VTSLHKRDPAFQAAWASVVMVMVVVATTGRAPLGSLCCVHMFVSLFFDTLRLFNDISR